MVYKRKNIGSLMSYLLLLSTLFYQFGFTSLKAGAVDETPVPALGCKNDQNAHCVDFGSSNESSSDYYGTVLGEAKTEGGVNFKELPSAGSITLTFPQIGTVDSLGLPNQPMMLEIRYKDTIKDPAQAEGKGRFINRAVVRSKLNFTDPSITAGTQLEWDPVGTLGTLGDNAWYTYQIPFPKTNWQRIRAIDGKFNFAITLPANSPALPLDYASLNIVGDDVIDKYNAWLISKRDMTKVENVDSTPSPSIKGSFAWFTTSMMQPVYPNTKPAKNSLNKTISMFGSKDELATASFSIYAKDKVGLSFNLNDLEDSNGNKIPKENVMLKRVVYDDKFWYKNVSKKATYGLVPDRVEGFTSISIKKGESQQFYLYVRVPKEISEQREYTSKIEVISAGKKQVDIPIKFSSLPITLQDTNTRNIVYHTPFMKEYSTDKDNAFNDMKAHEVETINNINVEFTKQDETIAVVTPDGYKNIREQLQYSIEKGTVKRNKEAFYFIYSVPDNIIKAMAIRGTVWERLNDERFKKSFKKFINDVQSIGKEYGVDIVFQVADEPGNKLYERKLSDRIYRLIKEEGGKTWVTYSKACNYPMPCEECKPCAECEVKDGVPQLPSLEKLTDYIVWTPSEITQSNLDRNPKNFSYYTTYYSQIRNPIYNRFLHGLFAEKTGAKVVASYAYGDWLGDPYNDFDANPYFKSPYSGSYDYILAYPSWSGRMIPTVAWEGVREGIVDAQYIDTLKSLIALYPNDPKAKEASSYLTEAMDGITANWEADYVDDANNYGFSNIILGKISASASQTDYSAFDKIRKTVADYIIELQNNSISVTSDKISAASGETVTYTVSYTNRTGSNVTSINISDQIPSKAEYVSGSASNGGVLTSGTLNWKINSLPAKQTFTATFKVKIK